MILLLKELLFSCKVVSGSFITLWTVAFQAPLPSVFPSGEPGVSGDFWGSQEGCQGPSRPSGRNSGLPLRWAGGATPRRRPGAVAGETNPTSKEPWLRGCRRA